MANPDPNNGSNPTSGKVIGFIVALVVALVGAGIVIQVSTDDEGHHKVVIHREFKVIATPGPDFKQPVVADKDNQIETDEQAEARKSPPDLTGNPDLHEDTRDETPPGVSPAEIKAGEQKTETAAGKLKPEKVGGAQNYSCPGHLVRNRSQLNGPRVGTALHFTVSSPGSEDAIIRLFDTPSFGASSNKIIELNGRCRTLVPNDQKAWAQLTANSAYFSIEIVTNDLTRAQWLAAPIIKKGILAALVRDLQRSIGSPLKLVDPSGCFWTPGITDHNRLECGNVHWDVGQNFPWGVFIKQVRAGVCDYNCRVKREHASIHPRIRKQHCATKPNPGPGCNKLLERNQTLHRVAKRRGIKL